MVLTGEWRMKRRRGGDDSDRYTLPTIDDIQPLETQEQEEMVRSFERADEQQSRLWRGVFAAFMFGYVVFLIYSIFQQAWHPWELRYHAYFMEDVHHWMIIAADWVAIIACLLAVKGMLHSSRSHHQLIWYSVYVGVVHAGFWLYYMSSLPRFRWDVLWLPFGPLSAGSLCLYVDHLLKSSREEIRTLQSFMYEYKRRLTPEHYHSFMPEIPQRNLQSQDLVAMNLNLLLNCCFLYYFTLIHKVTGDCLYNYIP